MGCLLAAPASAADAQKAALDLRAQYAADLQQLAAWCEANGLADEAQKTRRLLGPSDPYKIFVPILPVEIGPAKLPSNASPKQVEWDTRLTRLRRDHATAIFEIARRAVHNGKAGLAFDLAVTALQTDPDFEPARRLFGYQKYRDQWRTSYEARKLRAGFVWSDRFGWIKKAHLSRYEAGQRYDAAHDRWISAEEDARRHQDIRAGWNIETEHYAIRTNHSIEAAVALGVKLEHLNRLWQQLFIRYFASAADVVALFDGRLQRPTSAPRYHVVYFRNRDDYNNALRAAMPNIGISVGAYVEPTRRAYFFASEPADDRTLYHEATHQLFHESRPVALEVGSRANFWIVEGIAMFMETLRQEDGFYVLGGSDDNRMFAARHRLLVDNFYVPLDEFTCYNAKKFQNDPRIATLYSQAAGLANFLVFNDGGRYRDALVAYLVAVYTGHDHPDTLAKLTGVSYDVLDNQYREFVERQSPKEGTKN